MALNRRLPEEIARVSQGNWEVTVAAPKFFAGDLRPLSFEPLPASPCRVEKLSAHLTRWIHVMFYGARLRALLRQPWDLVHVWQEPFTLAAAQVAALLPRKTPLVFATFQNITKRYPPPFGWLERFVLRRSCGWIAFGQTTRATLSARKEYAIRPHAVIPPGVDCALFKADAAMRETTLRKLGWTSDGPPVVGFVGRFVPEKGGRFLADVLDRLTIPWRALWVGHGPEQSFLTNWAAKYNDRVRIVVDASHNEVPEYLNAMDLLAAPSQTTPKWREQFGRMLAEAMACSVPVVASNSGEIPHVIEGAGVALAEADGNTWVEMLSLLLTNPTRRAELAEKGRARALEHFDWKVVAAQHLSFFGRLLGIASAIEIGSAAEAERSRSIAELL